MGEYLRQVLDHAHVLVHFCSPTAPPSARIRGASVCTKRFPGRACSPDPTKEAIFHGNPRSVVLAKICRSRTVLPRRPRPSGQNASCRLILYRAARFCFQPTPERPRLWMLLCDPVNFVAELAVKGVQLYFGAPDDGSTGFSKSSPNTNSSTFCMLP